MLTLEKTCPKEVIPSFYQFAYYHTGILVLIDGVRGQEGTDLLKINLDY